MKDGRQTEKTLSYWLKKSFSLVLLVLASLAMMSTAFKKIPGLEDQKIYLEHKIHKLEKSVQDWANAAANAIFERNKAQKENLILKEENTSLKEENSGLKKAGPVVIRAKLSRKDSLNIARNLRGEVISSEDSVNIYLDYLHKKIKSQKSGYRVEDREKR